MTFQSELNVLNSEILNPCSNSREWNLVILVLVSALIGFSVHGWLCIQNIIRGDKAICDVTFNIAIIMELMFILFIVLPLLIGTVINCMYPRKQEVSRAVAPRISAKIIVSQSPLRIVRGSPLRRASLS